MGGKRKGAARKPRTRVATKLVMLRLTLSEFGRLDEAAIALNVPTSELIRLAANVRAAEVLMHLSFRGLPDKRDKR